MADVTFTNTAILETASSVTHWGYAGDNVTRGKWVYFDKSTSRYKVADCIDVNRYAAVGVALNDAGAGQAFKMQTAGGLTCDNLTAGASYVLSRTGKICPAADYLDRMDYLVEAGVASSTTRLEMPATGPVVTAYRASNLLGLWLLNESTGATANDVSGNARHGTATGVTWGATGIGDGYTAASFDGINDVANLYTAGLAGAFNGAAGTLMIWVKVNGAGVWTDDTARYIARFYSGADNYVELFKSSGNVLFWAYKAGGTLSSRNKAATPTDFFVMTFTWDRAAGASGEVKAYYGGAQEGATLTGLGTWTGSLATSATVLGASNSTGSAPWSGYLAHCALWNVALTSTEITSLAVV